MRFVIKHEIKGRIRIHLVQKRMTLQQADILQYYLEMQENVDSAKVQERTCDATICYHGSREEVLQMVKNFTYERVDVPEDYLKNSGREMNREYKDKLVNQVVLHYGTKLLLPFSVREVIAAVKSVRYLWNGLCTLCKGKLVMMTGDSDRIASNIAGKVGVDEYYSEVLPEDKAGFVEKEKADGRKVIMIGDGINDSPALSQADVGIAISDGAEIAREIADVTIAADDLREIITLRRLSEAMMKRIRKNYRRIIGINSTLIVLGVMGLIPPTMSALFHNTSTLLISLESMKNLLDDEEEKQQALELQAVCDEAV